MADVNSTRSPGLVVAPANGISPPGVGGLSTSCDQIDRGIPRDDNAPRRNSGIDERAGPTPRPWATVSGDHVPRNGELSEMNSRH